MYKLLKINEMVKNLQLLKSILRLMFKEINNFFKLTSNNIHKDEGRFNIYRVDLMHIPLELSTKVINILRKYKRIMLENDIIMSYSEAKYSDTVFDADFNISTTGEFKHNYIIYCKNLHTMRVKPKDIIYHYSSPEHRESILKNGLIPKESKDSEKWSKETDLEYPPVIFAVNDNETFWYHQSKVDVWAIDTTKIPNKWWRDINNRYGRTDLIMTFDTIPPQFITLAKSLTLKPNN
jgi:hypothetical protein